MPKLRFEILAEVKGKGEVKHVIRAESRDEAEQRFKQAYPDRDVEIVMARKVAE